MRKNKHGGAGICFFVPSAFAVRLERETPGIVKELEQLRRTIKQWTIKELEEMIAKYKELIK